MRELVPRHARIINADDEAPSGRKMSATTNCPARSRTLGASGLTAPVHLVSR
jgi:hypothetical protein